MDKPSDIKISPGRLVCWQGSSKTIYGIVREDGNGKLRVFVDDTHSFSLDDVKSSMVVVK